MDKETINEQFDIIDLFIKRFGNSIKKFIVVSSSIFISGIAANYVIQEKTMRKKEKMDFELRKDFIEKLKQNIEVSEKNSSEIVKLKQNNKNIEISKLEKKDYITKVISDEYTKIMQKDYKDVNPVAIEQIQTFINEGILKDELMLLNTGNYTVEAYRKWKFYNKNN